MTKKSRSPRNSRRRIIRLNSSKFSKGGRKKIILRVIGGVGS